MLKEHGAEFTYREYTKDPLSTEEITAVLGRMGLGVHDMLRARDAKKLGIDATTISDAELIAMMASNPTLLQRPIMDNGTVAVLGRPAERVLEVVD